MNNLFAEMNYHIGYLNGQLDALADNMHTCGSKDRYPFPPDRNCSACRRGIEKHVKRFHLETAYILFGWDMILESYVRAVNVKSKQAQANRQMGAYI